MCNLSLAEYSRNHILTTPPPHTGVSNPPHTGVSNPPTIPESLVLLQVELPYLVSS